MELPTHFFDRLFIPRSQKVTRAIHWICLSKFTSSFFHHFFYHSFPICTIYYNILYCIHHFSPCSAGFRHPSTSILQFSAPPLGLRVQATALRQATAHPAVLGAETSLHRDDAHEACVTWRGWGRMWRRWGGGNMWEPANMYKHWDEYKQKRETNGTYVGKQ